MAKSDGRKRYPAICPECKKEIFICKSLGMEIGWMKDGTGTCSRCQTFLHMTYNPELDKMYVERFQDWKHPD